MDERDAREVQSETGRPLTNERIRELDTRRALPMPPLQWAVEDTKSGVRITVVNDGPLGNRLNGATHYDVHWSETVDTTTAAGKAAGYTRSICLSPSIPATGIDHTQSTGFFADPKYAAGYFYVTGVDAYGNRSAPTEPARVVTGAIDFTIPGDVRHLQISESGRVANGTVFSELSVTCEPPTENIGNFGGVQLYLQDYLALGDIQEGYFQKWNGSGGINFAPLYPIPRRRSSVSVTATNGSDAVTAASGLLAVARVGEQFELLGQKILIDAVTDTQITLASNWPLDTISSTDYVIIGKPTIYAVSVSKAGTRRADIENAPSVAVLMDGELSAPNSPSTMYLDQAGVAVRVSWDQVVSDSARHYNVYRSPGNTLDTGMLSAPPQPASTTTLIDRVAHNPNLPNGATSQSDDSNFTLYELETRAEFIWYVTTTNVRGDESGANYAVGTCRPLNSGEADPTVPGRDDPKNFIYNAYISGTSTNQVLANDTSQDANTGSDASNLPGRPYQSASGQADGTGRFRGYTRLESNDGATGAAGTVTFTNGDEVHYPAPGAGNGHFVFGEIGAWDHGTAVFRKIEKGSTYVVSVYARHGGVTPNGTFYVFLEQQDNGVSNGYCLLRTRDSNGDLTTAADSFTLDASILTDEEVRFYAVFQMDTTLTTKQLHYTFAWLEGTVGEIYIKKIALQRAENPPQWTGDMGDTTVSIPVPSNPTPPVGDRTAEKAGGVMRIGEP